MPVYHFVFHAYGTWLADHPEGYYDLKVSMHLCPNQGLGEYERRVASHDIVEFTRPQQLLLLAAARQLNQTDDLGIHAAAVVSTHVHVVVSWNSSATESSVYTRIKQRLTYTLNKSEGKIKGQWFSRGAGKNKIRDMDHLIELVRRYIPGHGNNVWIEEKIQLKL